jgi:flagellar biosynthesis protein
MTKIVNKSRLRLLIAVALRYQKGENLAPQVVGSGQGELAQKKLYVAEDAGIPFHKDTKMAEILKEVNVGGDIPAELNDAVAKVLAFLMETERKANYLSK